MRAWSAAKITSQNRPIVAPEAHRVAVHLADDDLVAIEDAEDDLLGFHDADDRRVPASSYISCMPAMSPPALKALPAPVRMTTSME